MENKKKTKETDKTGFKIPFQPSQTWKEQHYKCSWAAVLWWANLTVLKEMFASFRCWKTNQVIKLSTSWNVSPACKQNNSKIQKKNKHTMANSEVVAEFSSKQFLMKKKKQKKTHTLRCRKRRVLSKLNPKIEENSVPKSHKINHIQNTHTNNEPF